jgi:hypothetical protein
MDFKLATPFLEAFEELNKIDESLTSIRCMCALYEDDDGYVCKTGVYAGGLSEEELEEFLTEKGMSYVQCWGEYFREESVVPELGEVVEVFTVEKEDIEEVAAIAGKDPEEYEQIGFFESLSEEITEATDFRASKEFWSSAKIGSMDEDAFHKAFDQELTELGLMDMFDADGVLANDYGRIAKAKEANPDSWAAKALGKLWALRYKDQKLFRSEKVKEAERAAELKVEAERIEAEKKKQIAEEKAIRLEKNQELVLNAIAKVDPEAIAEYEKVAGFKAADAVYLKDVPAYIPVWNPNIVLEYGLCFKKWDKYYKINETKINNEARLIKILNDGFRAAAVGIISQEATKELMKIDVFANNKTADVILLGESGTLYNAWINGLGNLTISVKGEKSVPVYKIEEPYEVIFTRTYWDNNNHSTYRDSESAIYYSWNSKHADKIKDLIPESFGREDGYMGSYVETTKVGRPSSRNYSRADGIDSWAVTTRLDVAND